MLLAIDPGQREAYRRTLTGVYTKRIRVVLLDKNGGNVENLTRAFQDGRVLVDTTQDVDRSCSIMILDPGRRYGFDADTYQGGELDLTRQLRVWWIVDGPLLARPVSIPVHTGPLTRIERDGALVTIEAQGKEVRGMTPSMRTLNLEKGMRRTDAIKRILRERMGERRLGAIPDLDARLPDDFTIGPKDLPWVEAQRLAGAFDRQLFYGGDGVPYLRKRPAKPLWRFRGNAEHGEITSPVVVSSDLQKIKNRIRVVGATPKGKKKPVDAVATADRTHPMSPWELGIDDAPVWLLDEITNDRLRTEKECRQVADSRLDEGVRLVHDTSFNAIPVPHLEPLDLISVHTDYETPTTRLRTFELPLGLGSDMSVGYVDPYKLHRRRAVRTLESKPRGGGQ